MWDTFTCRIILNGIVVKVGCQRVFFPSPQAMCKALEDYIENPQKSIAEWRDTPYQKISEGCGPQVAPGQDIEVAPPSPPETYSTAHVTLAPPRVDSDGSR